MGMTPVQDSIERLVSDLNEFIRSTETWNCNSQSPGQLFVGVRDMERRFEAPSLAEGMTRVCVKMDVSR